MARDGTGPEDDAALLEAVRAGGRRRAEAFAALFRAHREPVLALCLHLTGRRVDAEDAAQETFLAAHRALPGFRGEARLSTWLYRIAVRASLQVKARRRPHLELDDELGAPGSAEAALLARDEARRVQRALQLLPTEQRAVLALFAVEGLSHAEVADVLGVPVGTVWSRLHLARRRLAEALERG